MKTPIKLALVVFGAAAIAAAMPLASFADDATPEGGGSNCSNIRTLTNSRCVHYNEKAHDGWANQQAQKSGTGAGSQAKNAYIPKPYPTDLPPLDALKRAASAANNGDYVNWGGSFGSGPHIPGSRAGAGGSGGAHSSR